jgi:putative Mn2+ efflux pump MntP
VAREAWLLVLAVIVVGALHTLVPDHWVPITLIARQRRWTRTQTARAAFGAGLGHTLSTLAIGIVVWIAGAVAAQRLGTIISLIASVALIGFGSWIALASWRELREDANHGHEYAHERTALMLILGSSPMVEGIPVFFAAAKFGVGLVAAMSVCLAVSTIGTYIALCTLSAAVLARLRLGPLERYGEILSGLFIVLVGIVFLIPNV